MESLNAFFWGGGFQFSAKIIKSFVLSSYRPVEMKKILVGLRIVKCCRPPWLTDEENFEFQIV